MRYTIVCCVKYASALQIVSLERHFIPIEMVRFHVSNLRTLKWRKTTILFVSWFEWIPIFQLPKSTFQMKTSQRIQYKMPKRMDFRSKKMPFHHVCFDFMCVGFKETDAMLDSLCRCHQNFSHHYYTTLSMFRLCVWPRTVLHIYNTKYVDFCGVTHIQCDILCKPVLNHYSGER